MTEETVEVLKRSRRLVADVKASEKGEELLRTLPQGHGSGLDADTVDGLHAVEIIAKGGVFGGGVGGIPAHTHPEYVIPSGLIAMWAGFLKDIWSGWVLCDGQNGTVDLRDRFILGVGADEEPGETGGSLSLSHSGVAVEDHPALSHAGVAVEDHPVLGHLGTAVANHAALTHSGTAVNAHSTHAHDLPFSVAAANTIYRISSAPTGSSRTTDAYFSGYADSSSRICAATYSAGPTTHTVTQPSQHAEQSHNVTQPNDHAAQSHDVTQPNDHAAQAHSVTQPADHADIRPPFYKLAFIMKL